MSKKDMLGPIIRALVGVDLKHHGLILDVVNRLGGKDADSVRSRIASVLRMVSEPTRLWVEKDGIVYFSVTTDGTRGGDWIERFEDNHRLGVRVQDSAKGVLSSPDFLPTFSVTYGIAVLKASLFEEGGRTVRNILAQAAKRNLNRPKPEVACLIREKLTEEEIKKMGLRHIVVMHEQINRLGEFMVVNSQDNSLGVYLDREPDFEFRHDWGFAFLVHPAIF